MPNPQAVSADVLIVTVTPVESKAVLQAFKQATGKKAKTIRIDDRDYRDLGEINGTKVFMALSEMGAGGLGGAQQTVQRGIAALHPSAVIMVGIAFGIDEKKQAIGDILVSQQLMLYEAQRLGAGEIRPRGDRPSAAPPLLSRLRSAHLDWKGAKVRFGLVLTGEKLVDEMDYRESLKKLEPEAIGGEMEGAELYVACQDAKVDWILVKAICDWADGNKDQDKAARQQQAAQNAADFVLHALRHAPLVPPPTPPSPPPLPTPTPLPVVWIIVVVAVVIFLWLIPNPGPGPSPPMIHLPGGEFLIKDPEKPNDESTRKMVKIEPFKIGKHKVTRADYAEFMTEQPDKIPKAVREQFDKDSKDGKSEKDPMTYLAFTEIQEYLCWLNAKIKQPHSVRYRLPTEMEWEYAAQTEKKVLPYPDIADSGVQDMLGGISEWTCSGSMTPDKCGIGKVRRVGRSASFSEQQSYGRGISELSARATDLGFRLAQGPADSGLSDCPPR